MLSYLIFEQNWIPIQAKNSSSRKSHLTVSENIRAHTDESKVIQRLKVEKSKLSFKDEYMLYNVA